MTIETAQVRAIKPEIEAATILAGAQFVDAYRIAVSGTTFDARSAMEHMLRTRPVWIEALMGLRNRVLAPFGIKTSGETSENAAEMIWIFPIESQTAERLVAGFDDRHLDFRLVVDISKTETGQTATTTTFVRTHNRFGSAYLATILPFHRIIVRTMLRKIGKPPPL